MSSNEQKPTPSPQETANQIARSYFGEDTEKATQSSTTWQWLIGALESAVLIPALFYLRFHRVDGFAWGVTIFFVAYCVLTAVGLYFRTRSEYHTPVALRGDWLDYVGAFWLVACVFGPLLGWILTAAFPLTITSWRWLYALRILFAAVLPLLTALPLTRYLRGKAMLIALPILVAITLLPLMSVVNVSRDLLEGPTPQHNQTTAQTEYYLSHTGQSLGPIP